MSLNRPENTSTEGIQLQKGAFVVMVKTEWNRDIIDNLAVGAMEILSQHEVNFKTIVVPGAFEISFAIKDYWENADELPDAFIALGCVIRGDTPHFDYVCKAVTDGIVQLNLHLPVPTIFGILTVDNQQQATERIGGKHGHKGEEAATTAMKMIALSQSFKSQTT
jgi:6,7-dimethyl-8-ribityllumazine synthase